jgi:hypothetical protein
MLLLGLLLVGSAAAFTGLLVAYNSSGGPAYDVVMFGHHLATMNGLRIFLSGIALALVFSLGFALLRAGEARARSQRVQLRETRAETRRIAAERDALAERLDETGTPDAVVPVVAQRTGNRTDALAKDNATGTAVPVAEVPVAEVPVEAAEPVEPVAAKQPMGLRRRFSH